jgi:hypothetical protein
MSDKNIVTFLSLFRKDVRIIRCQKDDFMLATSSFAIVMLFDTSYKSQNTEQMG